VYIKKEKKREKTCVSL